MKNKNNLIVLVSIFLLVFTSCTDLLDLEPSSTASQSQITELASKNPDALAEILEPMIAGMYGHLIAFNFLGRDAVRHSDHGIHSILHMAGMMGEDIVQTSGSYGWYWYFYLLDNKDKSYTDVDYIWKYFYRNIKLANDIIIQIPEDTEDPTLKAFRGQALATRAYSLHYLVQLFQKTYASNMDAPGVPIITETPNPEGNPRAPLKDVYAQMVSDLTTAVELLEEYQRPSKGFINANVAYGFLARVYLTMEEWDLAAEAANSARIGYSPMTGDEYLDGFKYLSNPEWMFGTPVSVDLPMVQSGIVNFFSMFSSFSYGYASLTAMHKAIDKRLYDHMSATDKRKLAYQAPDLSTFPNGGYNKVPLAAYINGKFGPSDDGADNTQDLLYMRAAEMYLIEAEALAALNQTGAAANLLNELMRARDPNYNAPNSNPSLLDEIRLQRRIELWGEGGVALFDIKRLKKGINRNYTGTNHPTAGQLVVSPEDWLFTFQIPISETDNNPDITEGDNNP